MNNIILSAFFIATSALANPDSTQFHGIVDVSCGYSIQVPEYVPKDFELGHVSKGSSKKPAIRYKHAAGYVVETIDSERKHSIVVMNDNGEGSNTYNTIFDLDSIDQLLSGDYFAIVVAGSFDNINGEWGSYHAECFKVKSK